MLSLENPRLAGFMLTGNRSMFLETDGSVAWLYHCPKVYSHLHTMTQCYDRIPILYEDMVQFVDPITRQTYLTATPQNCSDRTKNLFQLDMDDEDSWFVLTPHAEHRDKPAIFTPRDISPISKKTFPGSRTAGMYTRDQLNEFWNNILLRVASQKALTKFSREFLSPSQSQTGPDGYSYYTPRENFYVDNLDFSRFLSSTI